MPPVEQDSFSVVQRAPIGLPDACPHSKSGAVSTSPAASTTFAARAVSVTASATAASVRGSAGESFAALQPATSRPRKMCQSFMGGAPKHDVRQAVDATLVTWLTR